VADNAIHGFIEIKQDIFNILGMDINFNKYYYCVGIQA